MKCEHFLDDSSRLMCGPLSSKWEHLIRCVRSSEEASHIRGNLKLAAANKMKNRERTVADITNASNGTIGGMDSGSLPSERDELIAEYRAAEKELHKIRKRFVILCIDIVQYM